MKKLLIAFLIIVILMFAYTQYRDYKRFHAPEIDYVSKKEIDKNYYNPLVLQQYYQAVEDVNSYVRLQWNTQGIDVRHPEDDDIDTKYAVKGYTSLLANVKVYEDKLVQSLEMKKNGYNNKYVINFEKSGVSPKEYDQFLKNQFLVDCLQSNPEKYALRVGDYGPFVLEIQKLLAKKGYELPIDGVFREITLKCVGAFEQKNGLFPDGKIDAITLDYLMRD